MGSWREAAGCLERMRLAVNSRSRTACGVTSQRPRRRRSSCVQERHTAAERGCLPGQGRCRQPCGGALPRKAQLEDCGGPKVRRQGHPAAGSGEWFKPTCRRCTQAGRLEPWPPSQYGASPSHCSLPNLRILVRCRPSPQMPLTCPEPKSPCNSVAGLPSSCSKAVVMVSDYSTDDFKVRGLPC